jgi:hypothetical protein
MHAMTIRKIGYRLAGALLMGAGVLLAGCAGSPPSAPGASGYGPLKVNLAHGADFYITQDGKFAPVAIRNGVVVVQLARQPFQVGSEAAQVNICLSEIWAPEVQADPKGYKASCLSGAKAGARPPHSDALLVYSGKSWSDGSSTLMDETSLAVRPLEGYTHAWQINELLFVKQPDKNLNSVHGALFGYIVVYHHHERSNSDIMPIELVFPDR